MTDRDTSQDTSAAQVEGSANGVADSVGVPAEQPAPDSAARPEADPTYQDAGPPTTDTAPATTDADAQSVPATAEADLAASQTESANSDTAPPPADSEPTSQETEPAAAEAESATAQTVPGTAEADQATPPADPATAEAHQATPTPDPATARAEPATTGAEPATAQVEPAAAEAEPATAQEQPASSAAAQAERASEPAEVESAPPPSSVMPPAAPMAAAIGPVAEASANPGKWGRVDADGTVYVKTEDGERTVGSWHAGEPAEGLAHYARRFDDVRTEVELLEARLTAGSGDPKHTLTSANHIKDSLADAALVGDLAGLSARIEHVLDRARHAVESVKHARDEARQQAVVRKQDLVAEVEKIAEGSTQWKAAGDRLRAILDEWKTIKGVDRKTDDQLWKRFSKARDTFNRRRGSHFADLDRQRGAAKERKQELVNLAEELSDSDDWGTTAARYRDLMTEWKAAGRAPKEADDQLWQQFRAAQDKFFSRRSSVFNERDAELVENAKRKEALLAEAERINPKSDLESARAQLHRIQERWDEIGKVPRERIRDLEGKLRAIEDKVRNAADAQWRRSDPEAEARAAQFRERVEQFEAQAAKARAAGDTRRAEKAEAQATQWREWLTAAENAVASR